MYSELLNLTDGKATYEQFLDIEAMYMAKESMTKKQAVTLWKRRYAEKKEKPIPQYLKEIKSEIKNFKENREWLNHEIRNEEKKIEEKLSEFNNDDYMNKYLIEKLEKKKMEVPYKKCQEFGNDATIYIIYNDGSECIASGAEIVGGIITPKMQNIAYANYSDGWVEYDTLTGILVDNETNFFGDLSTDEGIEAREKYYIMIEDKFKS